MISMIYAPNALFTSYKFFSRIEHTEKQLAILSYVKKVRQIIFPQD